jgi:hypothetical protein
VRQAGRILAGAGPGDFSFDAEVGVNGHLGTVAALRGSATCRSGTRGWFTQ